MKMLAVLLAMALPAQAAELGDLMAKYETRDLNGRCTVEYSEKGDDYRVEIIPGLSKSREGMKGRFDSLERDGKVTTLRKRTYAGERVLKLIEQDKNLLVVMLWEDGELGADKSTFCELPSK